MTDKEYLQQAIDESRKCTPESGSFCVGAVIVTADGAVYKGYTHESGPHNHAEEEALAKAVAAGAELCGAVIYSSMEPCSQRASKPLSCSQLIINHGFRKCVYALAEPPVFVECRGGANLESAGIEVIVIDELASQVREINAHLIIHAE